MGGVETSAARGMAVGVSNVRLAVGESFMFCKGAGALGTMMGSCVLVPFLPQAVIRGSSRDRINNVQMVFFMWVAQPFVCLYI